MNKIILLTAGVALATSAMAQKPKKSEPLKTHEDSVAYALGVNMYQSLEQGGLSQYKNGQFDRGMAEQGKGVSMMSPEKADSIVRAEVKRQTELKNQAIKKAGEDWLANNAKKEGVVVTPSGLQYKVIKEGNGAKPDANDKVTVHYHGTLTDGTVFDSSVDRNKQATFGLNQVIAGWTEGLQYMTVGSKYVFYVPQNLGYGARAQGKIPAFSVLIFEVELFNVEPVK